MVDESKLPPQLEETADARPYEPPKGRGRGLLITAVALLVAGGLLLLLAIKVRSYALSVGARALPVPWWDSRLGVLALICGLVAIAVGLVAGLRAEGGRKSLRAIVAYGVFVAAIPICVKALHISTLTLFEDHKGACKNYLRQIGIGCHLYADENSGTFPAQLEDMHPMIMDNREILRCPSPPGFWEAAMPCGWVTPAPRGYVHVAGLRADDPGNCILAFDRPGNHGGDGQNVLFVDGSVRRIKAPLPGQKGELQEMLDATRAAVKKRGGKIRLVGE